jgi:hypothetical protein
LTPEDNELSQNRAPKKARNASGTRNAVGVRRDDDGVISVRKAGKASGIKRAEQAKRRQSRVMSAFARLKPTYQMQPYSNDAIDALEQELRGGNPYTRGGKFFVECYVLPIASDILRKHILNRDTLIKDLKALGIRSKRNKKRSG